MGRITINRRLILIIVAIAVTIYMLCYGEVGGPDVHTYFSAWEKISTGHIDKWRTPVYPCLIGLAQALSQTHARTILIILQNIVACISLIYIYRITIRLTRSDNAAFWVSIIMAAFPAIIVWRNVLETESFAINGSIFLIYCAIGIYDGRSRWNLLGFFFWLLFLIFLRPAFAYLLPVFAVAFCLMLWKRPTLRKRAAIALLSVAIVTGALLGYMHAFKNIYGVFTPTCIGIENDIFIMRQSGDLDPSKTNDKKLSDYIKKVYKEHGTGLYHDQDLQLVGEEAANIYLNWDLVTLNNLVQDSKTWKNQLKGIVIRTYYAGTSQFLYARMSTPFAIFNATMGWLYLIIIMYAVWLFVRWRTTGNVPWASFLLLMLGGSNMIVAIVGAYGQALGEWGRLVSPSLFIYLVMLTQLFLEQCKHIKRTYKH